MPGQGGVAKLAGLQRLDLRDFATRIQQLTEKLGEQTAKGADLDQLIRAKLGGLGYAF